MPLLASLLVLFSTAGVLLFLHIQDLSTLLNEPPKGKPRTCPLIVPDDVQWLNRGLFVGLLRHLLSTIQR